MGLGLATPRTNCMDIVISNTATGRDIRENLIKILITV
jgi:hypothetical protein